MNKLYAEYSVQRMSWCLFRQDANGLTKEFIHGGYKTKADAESHIPLFDTNKKDNNVKKSA